MEKNLAENKNPARARGDKLGSELRDAENLTPSTVNVSEPAFACQAKTIKNCKIFSKNVTNNFKNSVTRDNTDGYISGNSNLIPNRELLVEYLEDFSRIGEVKARVGDKGILMETMFLDRNPNKKFHARPIRRHIEVNRANSVKDYWLSRISRRPSLILRGFHIAPFLKIHDPEAPELFSTEARIFNMSTWRSVRRELRPRYFVSCLVIDVDDVSLEEINERRERAPVKYSWAVLTSPRGFQLYFLFDKPYEETANFEGFKDIYDDLVDIYGADKRSHYDKGSYFCIFPYSVNSKHGNFKTLLIKFPKITYTPDEMRELIADYKGYKDQKSRKIRLPGFKKDFWDGTPRGREWVKFLGTLKKDVELWRVYNGIDSRIKYQGNASIRCEILITMLIIRGFSDQFILELVKDWPYGLKYGYRANKMRRHPEYEESRIKALIKHAKKEILENPEFYIHAKMERGKGYSYKAICKLTGFDIVTVRKALKVLVESGRVYPKKPRKSRKGAKIHSLFYKPMCPNKLQGCQGNYTPLVSEDEKNLLGVGAKKIDVNVCKTQTLCRENGKAGKRGGARGGEKGFSVEPLGNVLKKMFNIKDSERERNWHESKKDTHEKKLVTPLRLVNPEIASELKKLEGRKKSEIKALYWELPKTDPLIVAFSEYLKGRELDLPLDEAFTLWVLQERARLRQEPKFYVGFT